MGIAGVGRPSKQVDPPKIDKSEPGVKSAAQPAESPSAERSPSAAGLLVSPVEEAGKVFAAGLLSKPDTEKPKTPIHPIFLEHPSTFVQDPGSRDAADPILKSDRCDAAPDVVDPLGMHGVGDSESRVLCPLDHETTARAPDVPTLNGLLRDASRSEEARRMAADEFMRTWPALVRELILGSPVATLVPDTFEASVRLLGQLEFFEAERTNAERAEQALVEQLMAAYRAVGGDTAQVIKMRKAATAVGPRQEWTNELLGELAKGFAIRALAEHTSGTAADALLQAIAIVLAIPAGPVSALFTAAWLLDMATQ